jgi:hypothetical protein
MVWLCRTTPDSRVLFWRMTRLLVSLTQMPHRHHGPGIDDARLIDVSDL